MRHFAPALLAAFLLTGCGGRGDDKTTTTTSPTPSPTGDPSPKPVGLEPSDDRPKDFRADIPLFPGSKIVRYSEPGDDFSATLASAETMEPILLYYEDQLPANGWKVAKKTYKGDDEAKLEADKSGLRLVVAVSRPGDTTNILIQVGKEKKKDEEKLPLLRGHPLPEDFPRDVPLHPDGEIRIRPEPGPKITLAIARPLVKVRDFYEYQLHKKGWKVGTKMEEAGSFHLEARKDERRLTLSIEGNDDDLVVLIEVRKVVEEK